MIHNLPANPTPNLIAVNLRIGIDYESNCMQLICNKFTFPLLFKEGWPGQ